MTEHRVAIPQPMQGGSFRGIQRVIKGVTDNIDSDFQFDIVTPEPPESTKEMFSENVGFRTYRKRLPGWGVDFRRPAMKRLLSEYDLIWNHAQMLMDVAANSSTPAVCNFHERRKNPPVGLPRGVREAKDAVEWKLINRGLDYLAKCERVVCVSNRSRDVVERRVSADAVRIYNGADFLGSELSSEDEGYIFSADNPEAAVYVGEKIGFPVKVLHPSQELKTIRDSLDIEVDFIEGTIPDEELADLYRKCSFYISGAYTDGFGLTALEANHFGKPSIVFDKEVASENIEVGVNGFAPANMYEMVEKARMLAENDEKRKDMGETAFEYAQENFTWEKAAERYREEFLSVLF